MMSVVTFEAVPSLPRREAAGRAGLLEEYLASRRIQRESKGRFFFLPTESGKDRSEAVGGDEPRGVAVFKPTSDGIGFWVHHAARMKFVRLGQRIFLQLEPTYLFTSD